jgi:Rieske Fe-S protein
VKRRSFLAITLGLMAQIPLSAVGATKKPTPTPRPKVTAKATTKASPKATPTPTPKATAKVTPKSTPSQSAKADVSPQTVAVLRDGQSVKYSALIAPITFYATVEKKGREYPLLVSKPTERTIKIFTARCTHQGSILNLAKLGEFTCDQHGARFDELTGRVIDGPTIQNLDSYEPIVVGDSLFISL